jgi:hypothetical protein
MEVGLRCGEQEAAAVPELPGDVDAQRRLGVPGVGGLDDRHVGRAAGVALRDFLEGAALAERLSVARVAAPLAALSAAGRVEDPSLEIESSVVRGDAPGDRPDSVVVGGPPARLRVVSRSGWSPGRLAHFAHAGLTAKRPAANAQQTRKLRISNPGLPAASLPAASRSTSRAAAWCTVPQRSSSATHTLRKIPRRNRV